MSKLRYLGVTLAYANTINPEPGVKRAPTADEQIRALANAAARQGGVLLEQVATAKQNEGLDQEVLRTIDELGAEAVYFLTIDAMRRGNRIDAALLQSIWLKTGRIDMLIEDVRLTDDGSFNEYLDMISAMNEVRERDSSAAWIDLINRGGQT